MTITAEPTDLEMGRDPAAGLSLLADPWGDGWTLPTTDELKAVGWPGARPEGALALRRIEPTPAQQYEMRMHGPIADAPVAEAATGLVVDTPPAEPVTPVVEPVTPVVEPVTPVVEPVTPPVTPTVADPDDSADHALIDLTEKDTKRKPRRVRRPRRSFPRTRLVIATLATAYWYFALATLALAVVVPLVAGWSTTTVMSNSMEPVISQGDVVAFAEYDGTPLGEGAIIQFADPVREGSTLTHRIVGINPDGTYETKGDANRGPDSTNVPANSIVGVGRMVSPYAGLPHFWLEEGQYVWLGAWILLTAVAAVVMTPGRAAAGNAADRPDPEIKTRPARRAPAVASSTYTGPGS